MNNVFCERMFEKNKDELNFKYAHEYRYVNSCSCRNVTPGKLTSCPDASSLFTVDAGLLHSDSPDSKWNEYARFYFINVTQNVVYEPLPQSTVGLAPLAFTWSEVHYV